MDEREAEALVLHAADGARLVADLHRPEETPRGGVVLVHGFSATRRTDAVVAQARSLTERGYLVLAYDGRGHGESDGVCTLGQLEPQDVDAAVRHLQGLVPHVATAGASLGAVAALAHAVEHPDLAGVVLVSMATSLRSLLTARGLAAAAATRTRAGRAWTRRSTGIRVSAQYAAGERATERIRRLRVPVAIVHGKRDTMIRPVAALELWANAPEPRHLALVDGMGHSFQPAAVPAVTDAVEWVFGQSAAHSAAGR